MIDEIIREHRRTADP